jgi:chemotaxis protein methyltransferase CheR
MATASIDLNEKHFNKISELVYQSSGINLKKGKEALVRARLMKRLRALGMKSVEDYMRYIEDAEGAHELTSLIDVMTTNKTSFFREVEHFNFLRDTILPELERSRLRFWSAACSSGEEPYSLAVLLRECIANIDTKDVLVLGTDISHRMLEKAHSAVYSEQLLRSLPALYQKKYFIKLNNERTGIHRVVDDVRKMVRLAWLNLLDPWPMQGPFDVIFCRNVMIYFDRPTQQTLINRFWEIMEPGGYLFVGHSEGLSAITHNFHYVRPATYRK